MPPGNGQPGAAAPSDLIRSVSRALRVLETVGASAGPLPVKVIARRCGLPLATAYHLVRTLAFEGYLERRAAAGYQLGGDGARRLQELVQTRLDGPERVGGGD